MSSTLILQYINHLHASNSSHVCFSADDSLHNVLIQPRNIKLNLLLNRYFYHIVFWSSSKTQSSHVSMKYTCFPLPFVKNGPTQLKSSKSQKIVGLTMSNDLFWQFHISNFAKVIIQKVNFCLKPETRWTANFLQISNWNSKCNNAFSSRMTFKLPHIHMYMHTQTHIFYNVSRKRKPDRLTWNCSPIHSNVYLKVMLSPLLPLSTVLMLNEVRIHQCNISFKCWM